MMLPRISIFRYHHNWLIIVGKVSFPPPLAWVLHFQSTTGQQEMGMDLHLIVPEPRRHQPKRDMKQNFPLYGGNKHD
uniref:Uncharacterized protein n=1 Tax=Arundo donax TaxID=35708 RepID=A0A0A8Z8U6_ARUDO